MSSYLVATLGAAIFAAAALIVDPTVAAAAGPQSPGPGSTRDGVCPEGFRPATPPLNPALGCLPDNIYMPPPLPDPFIPPGGCPSGWQPVTPPLNPVLICLPTDIILQPEFLRAVESAARLPGGVAAGDAAAQPAPDLSAEHDRHSDAGTGRRLPRRLGPGNAAAQPRVGLPAGYRRLSGNGRSKALA